MWAQSLALSAWKPPLYSTPAPPASTAARRCCACSRDERLVALIRRGNHHAFEALVARYQSRLLAFCRHMLSSREDAEDVLQEVFAAAFNAMLADEREINVRPWLYRIARNRSLNHLRRAQAVGMDSMDVHLSEGGLTTADKVHKREEFRLLIADVQDLPETQRTALLLREIDALSYDQIAEAMETTVPSVKSLLVRARVSLAEAAEARLLSCDEVRLELGEVAEGLSAHDRAGAPAPAHLRALHGVPQAAAPDQPGARRAATRSGRCSCSRSCCSPTSARPPPAGGGTRPPAAAARPAAAGAGAALQVGFGTSPPRPRPAWPPPRSSPPAPSRSSTPHKPRAERSAAVAQVAAAPAAPRRRRRRDARAGRGRLRPAADDADEREAAEQGDARKRPRARPPARPTPTPTPAARQRRPHDARTPPRRRAEGTRRRHDRAADRHARHRPAGQHGRLPTPPAPPPPRPPARRRRRAVREPQPAATPDGAARARDADADRRPEPPAPTPDADADADARRRAPAARRRRAARPSAARLSGSRAPSGTSASGASRITRPSSSEAPSTSTSERTGRSGAAGSSRPPRRSRPSSSSRA